MAAVGLACVGLGWLIGPSVQSLLDWAGALRGPLCPGYDFGRCSIPPHTYWFQAAAAIVLAGIAYLMIRRFRRRHSHQLRSSDLIASFAGVTILAGAVLALSNAVAPQSYSVEFSGAQGCRAFGDSALSVLTVNDDAPGASSLVGSCVDGARLRFGLGVAGVIAGCVALLLRRLRSDGNVAPPLSAPTLG